MKTNPSRRRIDPGFLVVLAIALIAIWPFISRAGLPGETDAELHIFRLAELTQLVQAGEFYPRWAPHFYYGYGYPIFNYYAPLSYYLGLVVDLLPWFNAVQGVKFVFVLGLLAGAAGIYGFVGDNWGRPAAYVAAAVYTYAPYIQYVDPHARGALAESFSFGIFPLALWGLDRLRRAPTAGRLVAAVLLAAAVALSHNLMAMIFFGLLSAWVLWQIVARRYWSGGQPEGTVHWLWVTLVLGLALAAFFWLPLGLERNEVNLNTLVGQDDNFDYHTHFLSLATLLGPSRWLDWGATEPVFVFNLGLAQWLLAGTGLWALVRRRAHHAGQGWFFAVAFLALIFMMLPVSTFIWEAIPLLPYLQFPWRLLGGTVAMLAVLAGIGVEALLRGRKPAVAGWLSAGMVGFCLLLALPLSQVPPWPADFGPANMRQLLEIELQGRWLGTTSTADFVPATVEMLPRPVASLLDDLREGRPLDRVNRPSLPETTTVHAEELTPLHLRFHVAGEKDFLLRLFLFAFPGWTAQVDGRPVVAELGKPEGFLVVPVPAGEHLVEVRFGTTAARTAGWHVSGGALLLTLAAAMVLKRQQRHVVEPAVGDPVGGIDGRVLVATLFITAVHLLLLQPSGILHYQSTGFTAEPARVNRFADFGDQIALIGYDVARTELPAGDWLDLTLYWKAKRPLAINYQVFVHLLDAEGKLAAQSDKLNPGDYPTKRWPLDRYVRDEHRLTLPDDLPPGRYVVATGLWVQTEGWRLPLFNAAEEQVGDHVRLFEVDVRQR